MKVTGKGNRVERNWNNFKIAAAVWRTKTIVALDLPKISEADKCLADCASFFHLRATLNSCPVHSCPVPGYTGLQKRVPPVTIVSQTRTLAPSVELNWK